MLIMHILLKTTFKHNLRKDNRVDPHLFAVPMSEVTYISQIGTGSFGQVACPSPMKPPPNESANQ